MIGVRELGIDDAVCQYGNIIRDEEAVEGDLEVRLRVPRGVRVAAARHRIVRVERRDQTKAVRDVLRRQRLCPGVCLPADPKDLRTVAQKVFVEVPAADDVIACFIFFDHVIVEHGKLLISDGRVGRISRKMQIDQNQFLTVRGRQTVDAVAAVKIEHLRDVSLDRQAAAQGRGNRVIAESLQTRFGRAVRLQNRIEQIRRVVVDGKGPVFRMVCVQTADQHGTLVNLIGTRRGDVNFLDQRKICIKIREFLSDGGEIFYDGRLTERARIFSPVHEETIVVGVSTEADVP